MKRPITKPIPPGQPSPDLRRRRLLGAAAGSLAGSLAGGLLVPRTVAAAPALRPTPMQSAGPFYPDRLPDDSDWDLVHVAGRSQPARGEVTELVGRVVDDRGRPIRGARVEIWQCDANARYHHARDPGRQPRDPGFQGYGRTTTGDDGGYRFLTIHPVPYPGRTPHVHFAVHGAGLERPLVTQMYVAGHPGNAGDFLLRRVPDGLRDLLLVPFEPAAGEARWRAEFRIVVAGSGVLG